MSLRSRTRSSSSHDEAVSTRSPRRTSVPEPVCVNSSFASSAGRVIDTEEDSGSLSSSALICSIFTFMPPWSQGCAIR